MKTIKFSHNWNNKLNNDIFTTIRKSTPGKKDYYLDSICDTFEVSLNGKIRGEVCLIMVEEMKFKDIPITIFRLDTGLDDSRTEELFFKFGMKSPDDKFLILTFCR